MSYDIIIIDHPKRFQNCIEFWKWYDSAVDNQQDNYRYSSPALQRWFLKYKDCVRTMNGEFVPSEDDYEMGEYQEADYGFGKDFIYVALAYSEADKASQLAFTLADEFQLAYFDNSGSGELHNVDGSFFEVSRQKAVYESIQIECGKEFDRRNSITTYVALFMCVILLASLFFYRSWGLYTGIPTLMVFIPFAFWSNRWIENAGQDVLKKYPNYQLQENPIIEAEPIPLLADIAWNFRLGQFDSMKDFYEAVVKYNEEVQGRNVKSLLNCKIECIGKETTFVLFDDFSEEATNKQISKVQLTCDDGHSFTGVEVLFKLNGILYPLLEDSDSTYFEGFHCFQLKDNPNVCHLLLGS